MKRLFQNWGFTPAERRAVLFIAAAFLLGWGYRLYQWHHLPDVVPLSAEDSLAVEAIRAAYFGDREETAKPLEQNEGAGDPASGAYQLADPTGQVVDLNEANQEQLEKLPSIGPVLAARIIVARDRSGGFATLDELLTVQGIGPKKLEAIRPFVVCKTASKAEEKN